MKKLLCFCLLGIGMFFTLGSTNVQAAEGTNVPLTADYFPDEWVLNAVKAFDTDENGALSQQEIDAVKKLSFPSANFISDFTQFQYFTSITELTIGSNSREQSFRYHEPIDLTMFSNLEKLVFYRRARNSDIYASALTKLKEVTIVNTDSDEEDENPYQIDLHGTSSLKNVYIASDSFVSFDKQTAIKHLYLRCNPSITNFEAFPLLEELDIGVGIASDITHIDLSVCPHLTTLNLCKNDVETILLPASLQACFIKTTNLKNEIKQLDVSAATELKTFTFESISSTLPDLSNNKKLTALSLTCKMPKQIDFSAQSQLSTLYVRDSYNNVKKGTLTLAANKKLANVSLHNLPIVALHLPDSSALQSLILQQMPYLQTLNLSEQTLLENLTLQSIKSFKTLDLSKQLCLKALDLQNLPLLKSCDLSRLKRLETLDLRILANMTSLTLPNTDALTNLSIFDTGIAKLDLEKLKNLKVLHVFNNRALVKLALSKNTRLSELSIGNNAKMTSLDLSKNRQLKTLHFQLNKKIKKLDLSKNTKLQELSLQFLNMDTISLTKQRQLKKLNIVDCSWKQLNLKSNSSLENLEINDCSQLQALDLSKNNKLEQIFISSNKKLKTVTVGSKPKLKSFYCFLNPVKKLDFSGVNQKLLTDYEFDKSTKLIGFTKKYEPL